MQHHWCENGTHIERASGRSHHPARIRTPVAEDHLTDHPSRLLSPPWLHPASATHASRVGSPRLESPLLSTTTREAVISLVSRGSEPFRFDLGAGLRRCARDRSQPPSLVLLAALALPQLGSLWSSSRRAGRLSGDRHNCLAFLAPAVGVNRIHRPVALPAHPPQLFARLTLVANGLRRHGRNKRVATAAAMEPGLDVRGLR